MAIEDGRFESLPDPAYVNGFVRAYATHLGVTIDGPVQDLPVPGTPSPTGGRSAPRPVTVTRHPHHAAGRRPARRGGGGRSR